MKKYNNKNILYFLKNIWPKTRENRKNVKKFAINFLEKIFFKVSFYFIFVFDLFQSGWEQVELSTSSGSILIKLEQNYKYNHTVNCS